MATKDDGDILNISSIPTRSTTPTVVIKPDVVKKRSRSEIPAAQSRGSEQDQYKLYVSTRTRIPEGFITSKLDKYFAGVEYNKREAVLILTVLIKRFIQKTVQQAKEGLVHKHKALGPRDVLERTRRKRMKLGEI